MPPLRLSRALYSCAHGIIVAHNHPSGDPQPSQEDNAMTERLREAGKLLAVPVLDHIIIGDGSYFSYRDSTAYLDA